MIVQCAWCLAIMGEKEPYNIKDVSHGICEECLKQQLKEIKKHVKE